MIKVSRKAINSWQVINYRSIFAVRRQMDNEWNDSSGWGQDRGQSKLRTETWESFSLGTAGSQGWANAGGAETRQSRWSNGERYPMGKKKLRKCDLKTQGDWICQSVGSVCVVSAVARGELCSTLTQKSHAAMTCMAMGFLLVPLFIKAMACALSLSTMTRLSSHWGPQRRTVTRIGNSCK